VITSTLILSNSVSGDACRGAGAYLATSSDFRFNTVVGNDGPLVQRVGGLDISGTPQVHDNNLYGNAPYDVTLLSSGPVSGTQNYWGTLSSADISARIYDGHDEDGRGEFLYVPYLGGFSADAPLLPPTGLAADFQDDSVILSWDAHPHFAAGWGYKVYYDDDSTLPPYRGRGLDEGDSPVDAGEQTHYTLTGLDSRPDVYLAVTVYDDRGRESWYSNVEWRPGNGYWIYLPFVPRSH
jgi:hypothetical protein